MEDPPSDDKEAVAVNRIHYTITCFARESLLLALQCGKLLQKKKAALPFGEWIAWVEGNLTFDIRTAQRYLFLYDNRTALVLNHPDLFTDSKSSLSEAYKRLSGSQQETSPQSDVARLRKGLVNPLKVVVGRLQSFTYDLEGVEEVLNEVRQAVEELRLILKE